MYRTDKFFMKDPATASSRIYIGNLAEVVLPHLLEEKFSNYGKIAGLVLQRGFGFIQFESDQDAQNAIAEAHGTMFHGRKLNVKQAIDTRNRQQPQQQQQQLNNNRNFNNPRDNAPNNDKPPNAQPLPGKEETNKPPQEQPPRASPAQQPPQANSVKPPVETKVDNNKRKHFNRGHNQDYRNERDDFREEVPRFFEPPPPFHQPTFIPPPQGDRAERNDCEIIVVSKALTEYAEYIENRLKSLGLIVDLLFPNEDVPIGRVLANISSRGCLYAILVMPQNEECSSLTLNILHGVPEEHRNMPIEDALVLITKNFEQYMRGDRNALATDGKMTVMSRHPENVQIILNLLAENRQISSSQYDKVISYLKEKMDLQSEFEISEGIASGAEKETKVKQAELQSRIMNILNKKPEEIPKIVEPVAAPVSNSGQTPLLNDPSVQKALDSLLLGDMFKGLTS